MWKRRDSTGGIAPAGVGDECDAYLAGEWAEFCLAHGAPLPPWAWLNHVAHAPEAALARAVQPGRGPWTTPTEWDGLRRSVVESLFRHAEERRVTVSQLQRAVLVPIELSLFEHHDRRLGNNELLFRILSALRHPSAQAGPR
jgi:hypothetical protein